MGDCIESNRLADSLRTSLCGSGQPKPRENDTGEAEIKRIINERGRMHESIQWAEGISSCNILLDARYSDHICFGNFVPITLQAYCESRREPHLWFCSTNNISKSQWVVTVIPRNYYDFANTRMPFDSNLGDGIMKSCAASTSSRVVSYSSKLNRRKIVARVTYISA